MRIRAVVQRYGAAVAGGAEGFCRSISMRLAARGHEVQVLTSTATDYLTWQPSFPAGTTEESGVEVVRLDARFLRDPQRFSHLDHRVTRLGRALAPTAQRDWLLLEGPILKGLDDSLRRPTDVTAFFTYLYPTTAIGATLASPSSPTVVHPTAHHEPQLQLQVFDQMINHTDTFVVSTPEEAALMESRTRGRSRIEVMGIGVDPIVAATDEIPSSLPTDRPYVVLVGRVDPAKGALEAVNYFNEYKRRHPGPLALVVVGHLAAEVAAGPDVIITGFVDEPARDELMSRALVLLQPSYLESFSLVLAEAWTAGVPALVQENCPATAGQVRRSGGGLLYHDYAGFEAALGMLIDSEQIRHTLGESGGRYVAANYRWSDIVDLYESILDSTIKVGRRRLRSQRALR